MTTRVRSRVPGKSDVTVKIRMQQRDIANAKRKAIVQYAQGELEDVQRRIVSGKTDPQGRRWAPWAFATMRQRQRDGSVGRGLLYRTGRLLRSFRAVIIGDKVSIQSALRYATFIQRGTRTMPARRIVDLGSKLSFNRLRKALRQQLGKISK